MEWRTIDNVVAVFVHPDDLRALALHEAAHSVIAQRLGLIVTAIEVEDLDGYTFIADFDQVRPNVRLCVLMAGVEAEHALGTEMPKRALGNGDQQRVADALLHIPRDQWSSALAQARQQAQRMVRVHRGAIFQVASALLERCIDGAAVLDGDALAALLDADGSAILRGAAAYG